MNESPINTSIPERVSPIDQSGSASPVEHIHRRVSDRSDHIDEGAPKTSRLLLRSLRRRMRRDGQI
ncbi:Hypothetical protein FKW44_014087 [Caligus rogercresseyi]|uniref:Uncharacterized protein n=1 Tax=Caligus rogercresseyi TaxID=217165 RepID=A0A7T8GYD6_CALRO|nr:Hypothetical protein FKW44_014087 [Caligus rogercresseyi]